MKVFEEADEFLGVGGVETNAVVCESPFEILVVMWWEIESESGGAEKAVEFR